MDNKDIILELQDTEWPYEGVDHDRMIARAIVYDDEGYFYFVRAFRDDAFGKAKLIETSGGGVEQGEDLYTAIKRELKEELGAEVKVIGKLGIVSDYYNLIHRHNINNYFLCRAVSFGEKNLTQDEIDSFHLSTLKMTYEEALAEYEACSDTRIGRLMANRELPVLRLAKEWIDQEKALQEAAVDFGFTGAAVISTRELVHVHEYRQFCEENMCGNFGANYSCPPYCGTVDEMIQKAAPYQRVLVLQTVSRVNSALDPEEAVPLKQDHSGRSRMLYKEMKKRGVLPEGLMSLAGPCGLCKPCNMRIGKECPFPAERASCMSAFSLDVTKLAASAELPLSWDLDQVTYFSLYYF